MSVERIPPPDRLAELEPLLPSIDPDWPEFVLGARCPDCGRFVGRLIVHFVWSGGVDYISAICRVHGVVIATGWSVYP